ncbi:unnamed protein product, partial [marine sediment metagenome]
KGARGKGTDGSRGYSEYTEATANAEFWCDRAYQKRLTSN